MSWLNIITTNYKIKKSMMMRYFLLKNYNTNQTIDKHDKYDRLRLRYKNTTKNSWFKANNLK